MLINSIYGSPVLIPPSSYPSSSLKPINAKVKSIPTGGLLIECSSRPKKKATAHHMKTRPRKSQPWDINHKPTVYSPLPPLPADWTLVTSSSGDGDGGNVTEAFLPSTPALQATVTSG